MTTKTVSRTGFIALLAVTLAAASASRVAAQTILFSDNFNRANNLNISASAVGMSGTAAPMTYKESDLLPAPNNDALSQVLSNSLYLAYGPNASTVGLQSHNFIDPQILTDGGFRVSMDMQKLPSSQTTVDNYCGFGVGISTNEMANLDLDYNSTAGPRGRFNNASFTGVADFYTCWTMNGGGDVQIFFQGAATDTQYDVNVGTVAGVVHTLRADFYPAGFGAGDKVNVFVYIDNALVVNTSFTWHDANANYIAASARIDAGFVVDNLLVQTIPAVATDPTLHWVGDGSANAWNTSSLNWSNLVLNVATNFSNGQAVIFDDSSANTNVTISGTVNPGLITVNNSAKNYAFSGGLIAGTNHLVKSGNGTLTLNQGNSYSGGTTISAGRIRVGNNNALGSGLVTLSGGTLSADSTARTLANAALMTATTALGDVTNNGQIIFGGSLDFGGAGRTLTINSDVVFAGGATNGILASKQGKGTLTFNGIVNYSGAADVQDGTVIYDGATVTDSDRLIADAGPVNGIARLIITNGATVTVNTTVGNLRSGRQASTGTNYVDLAGLYSLPNADSVDGNLTLQGNAADSEITFWPGGDFTARSVANNNGPGVGNTVFKFNGGILRARNDNPNFFEGLSQTLVQAGGANLDDGGHNITVNQNFLDGGGGGGLNKIGNGALFLNGINTYLGTTVVSSGTFGGSGTLSGPVNLGSGATLAPGGSVGSVGTLTINNNLTLATGSYTAVDINKSSATNDVVTGLINVAYAGTLVVSNISGAPFASGDTYTLFNVSGTTTGNFSSILILPVTGLVGSFNPASGGLTLSQAPAGTDFFTVANNSTNNILPVLTNDIGSDLTLVGVATPPHGTAVISGTNVLYSPYTGFIGTDEFTYTNQDSLGTQSVLTIFATVAVPLNLNDHYQVLRNSSSNQLDVLRNDGAGITLISLTQPTNGTAFISGTNISYTPTGNYFGPDSFTYTVQDGLGENLVATVNLDVRQYPNFVFILADDQGWTGLSVQMDTNRPNSKSDYYSTPTMEMLASQGLRFSYGYSPHPDCSPSRYSILTGKTPARTKMTDIVGRSNTTVSGQYKLIAPGKLTDALQTNDLTVAQLLKAIPGANYSCAHWGKWHLNGGGPVMHGFDANANDGATDNSQGNTGTFPFDPDPKRAYSVTDRALNFLDTRVTNGIPFYMQVSHYAVHETTQTSQSSFNAFNGKPRGVWHTNQWYAGMTLDLDINVGRVLAELDELGIRNSTYVIYQSDNGAPQAQSENYPLRRYKPEVWEGGTRVPTFIRGPGVPANQQCDVPVCGIDMLPTILQWATGSTSNVPPDVDGGSLVPLIQAMEQGSNSLPAILRGGELVTHCPHYVGPLPWPNDWQLNDKDMRPRSSIHDGHYKLVANYEPGTIELYDLNSDISESTNLSPTQLAIKWQLWVRLRDYLKMVNAQMPTLDPSYPGTTNGTFQLAAATGSLGDADSDGLPDDWEFRELLTYQYGGSDDPS
ncbi:MAG TPA: sulfatase-like hydrolase/transferase, partial [Verrucomicrobiae bacterium]